VNGFYSACTINYPYADDPKQEVRDWFAAYKGKYNEDPTVLSAYGYQLTNLFIEAANKAGKDLNPDTLAKSLETLTVAPDFFGADEQKFSATRHLGSDRSMLCQIQDGKWKSVSEYLMN
jgi:branched-chain amino acid transport system substrate-binding protein